jgi:nicotinamide phosphoribosyltransferase
MKANHDEVNNEGRAIFKTSITDDVSKKSAKGLLAIEKQNGIYILIDEITWEEEKKDESKELFRHGKLLVNCTFSQVNKNLKE